MSFIFHLFVQYEVKYGTAPSLIRLREKELHKSIIHQLILAWELFQFHSRLFMLSTIPSRAQRNRNSEISLIKTTIPILNRGNYVKQQSQKALLQPTTSHPSIANQTAIHFTRSVSVFPFLCPGSTLLIITYTFIVLSSKSHRSCWWIRKQERLFKSSAAIQMVLHK